MSNSTRRKLLVLGIILALLLIPIYPASAKGLFSRITVQLPNTDQIIDVTDPALLDFWAFSDFTDGTREAPKVVGPAYEVTRWYLVDDGKTYVMWDRLRYYHTSSENTAGRGWVYYEGLVNGGSEYDGRWYLSTRHADALMETIIFAEPNATVISSSSSPSSAPTVGIGTTTLFVLALILWIIQPR